MIDKITDGIIENITMNEDKLSKNISRLNELLERRSKAWNVFLTGVINGVGTAIGAALIGTVIIGLIASNLRKIPLLKDIIPPNTFDRYVESDK